MIIYKSEYIIFLDIKNKQGAEGRDNEDKYTSGPPGYHVMSQVLNTKWQDEPYIKCIKINSRQLPQYQITWEDLSKQNKTDIITERTQFLNQACVGKLG